MDLFYRLLRTFVVILLLVGVYLETGPATALILALISWKIDGIVFEVGLNIWNIESIADFLEKKHTDFATYDINEEVEKEI